MPQDNAQADGFRLGQHEKQSLLRALDEYSTTQFEKNRNGQKSNRYAPLHREAMATLEHPGGSSVSTEVLISEISSTSIEFITRSFLHEETSVTVRVTGCDNKIVSVQGHAHRCEYYDTKLHRVSIQLNEPIDPRLFITQSEWDNNTAITDDVSWMKPRKALHIEPDMLSLSMIRMMLNNAHVECIDAESLGTALDLVQTNPYDLVLISDQSNHSGLLDSINQLKNHGYAGPIIVLSSVSYDRDSTLSSLGVSTVLTKPVQLASLMVALRDVFENSDDKLNSTGPIYSTLAEAQCPEEQLVEFIQITRSIATRLGSTISTDDYDESLKLCKSLHAASAGFGYCPLSTIAGEVMQTLYASCSPQESASEIRQLVLVINRLRTREEHKNAA